MSKILGLILSLAGSYDCLNGQRPVTITEGKLSETTLYTINDRPYLLDGAEHATGGSTNALQYYTAIWEDNALDITVTTTARPLREITRYALNAQGDLTVRTGSQESGHVPVLTPAFICKKIRN